MWDLAQDNKDTNDPDRYRTFAQSCLKLALSACPDVPFIFVSGTPGEEVAIEALKMGATDYVLKTRLSRLAPSVRRALREARERTGQRKAKEVDEPSRNTFVSPASARPASPSPPDRVPAGLTTGRKKARNNTSTGLNSSSGALSLFSR